MIAPMISAILFWKRNKLGWILLSVLLTYSIVESIIKFLNAYLYDKPGMVINFCVGIFLTLLIYLICKPKVREIYTVSNTVMYSAIGWTVGLILITYLCITN
jgi:hypothetical protein